MRALPLAVTVSLALLVAACAAPEKTSAQPSAATKSSLAEPTRKDDAELVTGSRIPVRGAQPVRTIDKEEFTRNTRVIGDPAKGN